MQQSSSPTFAGVSHAIRCPHCHGCAYRIPRRWVDRVVSLFAAVRRYWCYQCDWQGNVRAKDARPFGSGISLPPNASLSAVLNALRARRAEERMRARPQPGRVAQSVRSGAITPST
jgi:hypothetical protein